MGGGGNIEEFNNNIKEINNNINELEINITNFNNTHTHNKITNYNILNINNEVTYYKNYENIFNKYNNNYMLIRYVNDKLVHIIYLFKIINYGIKNIDNNLIDFNNIINYFIKNIYKYRLQIELLYINQEKQDNIDIEMKNITIDKKKLDEIQINYEQKKYNIDKQIKENDNDLNDANNNSIFQKMREMYNKNV